VTSPQLETLDYLQSALAKNDTYAVVTQSTSGALTISAEVGPGISDVSIGPLVGPTGPAGESQFPLMLQPEVFGDPSQLPTDLTNTNADIGRYWLIDVTGPGGAVISSGAYIWFGTEFRVLPFGTQGPPGPYGVISPYVSLIGADETSQLVVTGEGTSASPYLATMELSVPPGPQGPCAPLASMADFDQSSPPTVGQFVTCTGEHVEYGGQSLPLWAPQNVGDIVPQCYTVPQSAFTAAFGITFASYVTIATFSVPPNAWNWKPIVFGQIQMFEAELSLNPLLIGVEVYLGSPNPSVGTLVARGFGNTPGGVVSIFPHTSSSSSPSTAMTPWNSVGLVEGGHGGAAGTLYVNLLNDGIAAIYDYNPQGAELFVMACPATSQAALDLTVYGSLGIKVTLSARLAVDVQAEFKGSGTLSVSGVEFSPVTQAFRSNGTYTYTPPSWWTNGTDYLDLIAVGPGGGGSTANDFDAGGPGAAGAWATTTIQSLSSGSLTVIISEGGAGSTTTAGGSSSTAVEIKDGTTAKLSAAAGAGGTYTGGGSYGGTGWYGPSPGNETFEGQTYYGGLQATSGGAAGGWPGGGGAGADQVFAAGGRGASGAAWIVARKA
jgi:hypothetical protein